MAAKPKLTPEQWADARSRWESDPRKGFPWLIEEMSLPVSAEALRLRSKSEEWAKASNQRKPGGKKEKLPPKIAEKPKLGESKKTKLGNLESKLVDLGGESNPVGRPTLYREEYAEQAYKLCLLGMTDEELAESFQVDERTINNWKIEHPGFIQSLIRGKNIADADVAESLYKRAVGYSHPDVHVSNFQGAITITDLTKHYPPDTGAGKLWLTNRQPKRWKDRVEIKEEINLNVFPPRDVLEAIYAKGLEEAAQRESVVVGRRERLGIVIEHSGDE